MVIKSIKFSDEEWSKIEEELAFEKNFSTFVKRKILNNSNICDEKKIDELKNLIINLIDKIEKETIVNNFKEFFVVATKSDVQKLKNIEIYQKGDVIENLNFVRSLILEVDKQNETLLITQFPLVENAPQKELKLKNIADKINSLYRIKL